MRPTEKQILKIETIIQTFNYIKLCEDINTPAMLSNLYKLMLNRLKREFTNKEIDEIFKDVESLYNNIVRKS